MFISGNEAISKGCIAAGASYLAGYPITPASDIMVYWLENLKKDGRIFLQTEDEIAAMHSIIGASLAGRKAFTPTSGPGFSLMQEGLGLAFAYRAPLVLVNVMRQGPSTGMPTLFSQDEIMQTQFGTHGDHTAIVFYPNSVQECFDLAIDSFNAACESSSPVILLSDAYLARMYENVNLQTDKKIANYPFEGVGTGTRHFTGLTNDNGRPDTKNEKTFVKWMDRIRKPIFETAEKYSMYDYHKNSDSDTLVISFGTTSRIVSEWKKEFALFRPIRLFPVLEKELNEAAKDYKNVVLIEGNYGQYTQVVQAALKREVRHVGVLGGKIDPNQIYQQVKDVLKK